MARNAAGEAAVTNLSSLKKIPEEGQRMKTDLLKKCFSTYQKRCESSTDFSYSSVSQNGGKGKKKNLNDQPKKKNNKNLQKKPPTTQNRKAAAHLTHT